ncbi:hypothetical protein B296_00055614 [Ensete ventricosum]|uniref:Uncharacterized protein n=1 Tax=Ensete ventricosum TaxID=4639 RepID=A0A426XTN9_ENSVE|nr:hypothetical protein B296_00055614 [Ensete ventricosum]
MNLVSLWSLLIKLLHKWMDLQYLLGHKSNPLVETSWHMLLQQGLPYAREGQKSAFAKLLVPHVWLRLKQDFRYLLRVSQM